MIGIESLERWQVMWGLAFSIFAALKLLSWWRYREDPAEWWRHAGYLLAWPGMDARAFLQQSAHIRPTGSEWSFAVSKLLVGLGLFAAASHLAADRVTATLGVGWLGMVGIVFVLHFGLFHLLSCGWRSIGVEARVIMDWPLRSTSLSGFWGRRWNVAFRDLSHRFVFRPLMPRLGATRALLVSFLASGLVHDLVISVPAGGGWGWPTAYFVLNGGAILFEKSRPGQRLGLGRGRRGWCFAVAVLVLPMAGLLHEPFVRNVILPFLADVRFF